MLQRQIEGDLVGKELGFETLEPTTIANRIYDDLTNGNVDSRPFSQRCFFRRREYLTSTWIYLPKKKSARKLNYANLSQ